MLTEFKSNASDPASLNIREYLLIEKTQLCPADVILIFGNRHCLHQAAERAAQLYHQGYAPKIIASGGRNGCAYLTEAESAQNSLRTFGVPSQDILLDTKATNTQENVLNTKNLAEQRLSKPIQRVIGVGTIVAGRRFLMTLSKNWSDILPMISNVNPFDTPINAWQQDPTFEEIVMAEHAKIPGYIKQAFIEEVNIEQLNQRIHKALKSPCHLNMSKA